MGIKGIASSCLLILFTISFSLSAWAFKPASHCSLDADDSKAEIEGTKTTTRLPIASVSKLVTTYWALSVLKPTDRYHTRIYITPVATDSKGSKMVDLHFEGSRDPYFGKESIHYLVSELNRQKITRIRTMSFDDNFKFFWNVGGGNMLKKGMKVEQGYYGANSPLPDQVARELKGFKGNILNGYSSTRVYLKKFDINLIEKPQIAVQYIKYKPASEFRPEDGTLIRVISSSPLIMLLREMNRNSNNHAANQIFESLGGAKKFRDFVYSQGFTDEDILFVNGHGNRKDLEDGRSVYNEASCATILEMMRRLRTILKIYGKDLDDVLPVPGVDPKSTLGAYDNQTLSETVAAKTGTIGPAVTLAGLLQTKKGPIFFMYNMQTKGTTSDWNRARKAIAAQLVTMTKKHNGGLPFDTKAVKFVAFDPEMFFEAGDWLEDKPGTATASPLAKNN